MDRRLTARARPAPHTDNHEEGPMGYDNRYTGEITITPPLTWGQLRDADAPKIADDGASSWESAIADCAREADYQTPAEAIAGLLGRF